MGITDFTGWHIVSGKDDGTFVVREVVGQFVADGDFNLVARDPETKRCEFIKLDSWQEGDLFWPGDRAAAEDRAANFNADAAAEATEAA
jgi:hypothetical protein